MVRRTIYLTPKQFNSRQRIALTRACAAINAACSQPLFAVRLDPPSRHTVRFCDGSFHLQKDKECLAFVQSLDRGWFMAVRPALEGELLMTVLLHELGHILGLGHARDPESLMCAAPEPRANAFDWVAHASEIAHRAGIITAAQKRSKRPGAVPVRQVKNNLSHPLAHNKAQAKPF